MAKVCIICSNEKDGSAVQDDAVINSIRAVKQRLGMAKNNTLVVCKDCMDAYAAKRKKYERDLVTHVVIAGVVLVIFVLAPILTTGFSITSVVVGILLAAIIIGLSVFSYSPRLVTGLPQPKAAAPAAPMAATAAKPQKAAIAKPKRARAKKARKK